MKEAWYKNAIIYALDVETFQDSNGDGIGDFQGLISRLPYLKSLGITCLWLLPFYPSPNRDNGYDITDYYNIDPRLGTLDDFKVFIQEAKKLEIRVVIDLVIQHTSDEHPWFKAAQADEKSPYRKYYIWAKHPTDLAKVHTIFPGEEQRSPWSYSSEAKLWYHHWCYRFQPDLDVGHYAVREEIFKIVKFWMSFGISGFRLDAAGLLFARPGMPGYYPQNPGPFLRDLRGIITSFDTEGVLFGEADVKTSQFRLYFGRGDRINVLYNFVLNQFMTLSIVNKQAQPIVEVLKKFPPTPDGCTWINFIRNLDEFNLEKLEPEDITKVKKNLHVTEDMWIYKRGIRRRIAPLLKNDTPRLQMMWGLMFSLKGNPMISYGDEIGMGDNLSLPYRVSVRIPMQWDNTRNAGFSNVRFKSDLVLPVIDKGMFSYKKVNVKKEEHDPHSQLSFIKRLIVLRKRYPEIGYGDVEILSDLSPQVMAFKYTYGKRCLIILHNLSDKPVSVSLPHGRLFKQTFAVNTKKIGETVSLKGYGQIWMDNKAVKESRKSKYN